MCLLLFEHYSSRKNMFIICLSSTPVGKVHLYINVLCLNSTPAGKRLIQLQQQIEVLQEEIYKLETGNIFSFN